MPTRIPMSFAEMVGIFTADQLVSAASRIESPSVAVLQTRHGHGFGVAARGCRFTNGWVGDPVIKFKKTSASRLYWSGRPAMRVVQALHWLKDLLPDDRINKGAPSQPPRSHTWSSHPGGFERRFAYSAFVDATISAGAVVVNSPPSISATRSKASWHFYSDRWRSRRCLACCRTVRKLNGSLPMRFDSNQLSSFQFFDAAIA